MIVTIAALLIIIWMCSKFLGGISNFICTLTRATFEIISALFGLSSKNVVWTRLPAIEAEKNINRNTALPQICCSNCKQQIFDPAGFCPSCGHPILKEQIKDRKEPLYASCQDEADEKDLFSINGVIGAAIVLFIAFVGIKLTSCNNNVATDNSLNTQKNIVQQENKYSPEPSPEATSIPKNETNFKKVRDNGIIGTEIENAFSYLYTIGWEDYGGNDTTAHSKRLHYPDARMTLSIVFNDDGIVTGITYMPSMTDEADKDWINNRNKYINLATGGKRHKIKVEKYGDNFAEITIGDCSPIDKDM